MSEIIRYRVNYRLLVSLVAGGFLTIVAAFFLWRFQVDRNAARLLERADLAQESSDDEEAYESLGQYVRLRPDEIEQRVRLGNAAAKLLEHPELDIRLQGDAYHALTDAVVRSGDLPLRRKLVDFYMTHGAMDRALQPIDELLDAGQKDSALKVMRAKSLFATQRSAEAANYCYKLIGYDPKADTFDVAKAEAVDQPEAYSLLAQYLYNDHKTELAARVADQMIATNPKSRDAYVFQYQLLKRFDKQAEARESLETAYELDKTDETVLLFKGLEELQDYQTKLAEATAENMTEVRKEADKHLDAAGKFFLEGREKHPDRMAFYEYGARVELARDHMPEALAIIDQGLKEFDLKTKLSGSGIPLAIDLANFKIDLYFGKDDIEGVRREIKVLRDLNNSKIDPLTDFQEARIDLRSGKLMEAARRLEDVKMRLINFPVMQALAGATQGMCYAQLGQYDIALQAYDWALEKNPGQPQALAGKEEMQRMVDPNARGADPLQLDTAVAAILALPKEQQNWDELLAKIDAYLDEQAKTKSADEAWLSSRKQLLRAQMYATRAIAAVDDESKAKLFTEARNAITEAYRLNPKDMTVQSAAPRLLALEPESGPTKALELLDAIVTKNGDSPAFRALRIDLLSMLRGEDFTNRMYAATDGMEKWTPEQQAAVWAAAGARFEQFGQFQDAQTSMARAADLAPNSLQHRVSLFDLALKQGDNDAMKAAQQKILEIVKSETDPNYVGTEVKRLMFGYADGSVTKEQMQEGRKLLERAIKQRPTWAELHLVNGQLWLSLERNQEQALASFDKALANGPANLSALNLQVRLLNDLGRYPEARRKMDLIPTTAWPTLLDVVGPNIMIKVGETEQAFAEAKRVSEARAEDPGTQMWFADIATRANKPDVAEAAMKKAIKVNPVDPDLWATLLGFYMKQRRADDVERILREAQLALDEEFLPLLMAKQHELFGRWPQAESILLSYYGDSLKTPNVSRRMAEFYLLWSAKDPAYRGKAAVYINNLLRAAEDGTLKLDDQYLAWARRQAARILSLDENYHDSLKAEKLLEAAIAGQAASLDDQAQLIEILNLRGDPASRERAVGMLQAIQKKMGGLSPESELQLGQGLYDLGEWEACQTQMRDAIGRHPDDAALRVSYINWLMARKDFAQAESWINRLKGVDKVAYLVPELSLRLAAARGEKDNVRAMLTAMTPNLTVLNAAQLQNLRIIALMATDVGDHEYGLKLMREYVRRSPDKDKSMELTRMIALHADIDEALSALKLAYPDNVDDTLRLVVEMLRARRAEAPEKLDEEASRFVRMARHDDPDSAQRMVLEAELFEILERYDDSVAAYRALLKRDDVPPLIRATAQNNLAFLLSLKRTDVDEALALVNDAVERVGPISDILDTRGLVHLAKGDAAKAVEDLQLCVKVGPTPSKYFHLTEALLAAGDKKAAVEAWRQAELRGIGPDKVAKVELERLQDVTKQIEALQSSTL